MDKGWVSSPALIYRSSGCRPIVETRNHTLHVAAGAFGGSLQLIAADGRRVWHVDRPGYEVHSSPAIGHFGGIDGETTTHTLCTSLNVLGDTEKGMLLLLLQPPLFYYLR